MNLWYCKTETQWAILMSKTPKAAREMFTEVFGVEPTNVNQLGVAASNYTEPQIFLRFPTAEEEPER